MTEKLINLYQQMYEHTRSICHCQHSCCSPEYCEMAEQTAIEYRQIDIKSQRTEHKILPYMGPNGCVLQPYLRPLCTVHNCLIAAIGVGPTEEWTNRYFELREQINEIESELWDSTT